MDKDHKPSDYECFSASYVQENFECQVDFCPCPKFVKGTRNNEGISVICDLLNYSLLVPNENSPYNNYCWTTRCALLVEVFSESYISNLTWIGIQIGTNSHKTAQLTKINKLFKIYTPFSGILFTYEVELTCNFWIVLYAVYYICDTRLFLRSLGRYSSLADSGHGV
jgi:hypothetical protein